MTKQRKRGLALIVVIGILAIAGIIAVTFAEIMLLQRREASNFLNSLKAQYIAEAGIAKTIADFRSRVPLDGYGTLKTYISNYVATYGTNVPVGNGEYDLEIQSEEDYFGPKVNINTFDVRDTSQIAVLQGAGLPNREIANIIDYRDYDDNSTTIPGPPPGIGVENATRKNQPYNSIGEVKAAFLNAGATMTDANNWYDAIKNYITIDKPITRGGLLAKYYSNITGTSPGRQIDDSSFVKEIVELGPIYQTMDNNPLPHSDWGAPPGWQETHDAEFAGGHLVASFGDFGLSAFAVVYEGYIDILPAEVGAAIPFWARVDDGVRLFINGESIFPLASWQDRDLGQAEYSGNYTFRTPGWHRIRVEYYDATWENTLMLKWQGASFGAAAVIPAEQLGYEAPTESGTYNHAGNYKIIATAEVLSGTTVIGKKKISTTLKVFGTWTQTTKEEFYAAWFGDNAQLDKAGTGDDFRDGEVHNVTWLDSCPTDTDFWDAGASRMHWEGNWQTGEYATVSDSVKLGFWDNFDEDPAYSFVMMKGYYSNRSWSGSWDLTISVQDFKDNDGDGDNEVYLDTNTFEAKHFEVNRYYFRPDTQRVFVRAYVKEPAPSTRIAWRGGGTPYPFAVPPAPPMAPLYGGSLRYSYYYDLNSNNAFDGDFATKAGEPEVFPVYDSSGNRVYIYNPTPKTPAELESIPAPGTYSYWQPEAPFVGCWIFAKGNADDTWPMGWGGQTFFVYGFKALLTDGHLTITEPTEPRPLWPFGDVSEIRLGEIAVNYTQFNYISNKVLALIGWDDGVSSAQYRAWVDGTQGVEQLWAQWARAYPNGPIFKFVANNQYLGWDWASFERGQHVIGTNIYWNWDKAGAVTRQQTHWDNIRCITENGYLVSTPLVAGADTGVIGATDVRWGRVSWTDQRPAGTNVQVYLRYTSTGLPRGDTFATSYANGASIGGTGRVMQYRVILSTTNIDRTNYSNSSRTPVFEDITITYIPTVQVFAWKEEP